MPFLVYSNKCILLMRYHRACRQTVIATIAQECLSLAFQSYLFVHNGEEASNGTLRPLIVTSQQRNSLVGIVAKMTAGGLLITLREGENASFDTSQI